MELIDRAATAGLLERSRDDDARVVRLELTPLGAERIAQPTALHLEEIRRLLPLLDHLTEVSTAGDPPTGQAIR